MNWQLAPSKGTKEMRIAFSDTLNELMEHNQSIFALEADLGSASSFNQIEKQHPKQFCNVGIAEANMMGIACGLALQGFIPFVHTFAPFATRRALDQIYLTGVYSDGNLKLFGSDPGMCAATNGGTHTTFEDIAIMASLPHTMVFDPADEVQLEWLIKTIAPLKGVHYIRANRKMIPRLYQSGSQFEIGKANLIKEGTDALIMSSGDLLHDAFQCALELEQVGIHVGVIDAFSLKPFDTELLIEWSNKVEHIITYENHNVRGGLGSIVASILATQKTHAQLTMMGIVEQTGEVGSFDDLKKHFGLTMDDLKKTILELTS